MTYILKAVGADPEFFLKDKHHKPMPAIGLIGGTKVEPRFINDDGFSAVQEDNVMVEFNIRPARSPKEFADNTTLVLDYLIKSLKDKGFTPAIVPAMEFTKKQLKHPQARDIGCLGDLNAWTCKPNPRPDARMLGLLRTSGAHVHISYEFDEHMPDTRDRLDLIRACDFMLGVPSVLLDDDVLRRKFYGKAGCFREKIYGVEYRTLSNFWIRSPELMQWVYGQVTKAIDLLNDGGGPTTEDEHMIQEAINNSNKSCAKGLVAKYGIRMP